MSKKKDHGAVAVEFALVLVPLLLILFGLIDFGRAFYAQISLDHIAREGVRVAALGSDPTSEGDWVAKLLQPAGLGAGNVTTNVCATGDVNGYASIVVTQQFSFLTPLPGLVPGLPSTITLKGTGEAKCYS